MAKRKVDKQQPAGKSFVFHAVRFYLEAYTLFLGPVSAVAALAARRARQQQALSADAPVSVVQVVVESGPPSKKPRRSPDVAETTGAKEDRRTSRTRAAKKQDEPLAAESVPGRSAEDTRPDQEEIQLEEEKAQDGPKNGQFAQNASENTEEMDENDVASVVGDADGYESPAETPAQLQNFPLSKARLNKSNIVYSDENTICIRLKERTVCLGPPKLRV